MICTTDVQERIEPVKPAREHASSIDGEIQTRRPDANFSNHQIWNIYTRGYISRRAAALQGDYEQRWMVIQLT